MCGCYPLELPLGWWCLMAVLLFPEALNQHPLGPMDFVRSLAFSILLGIWMYLGALSSFWFHGLLFKRRPLRTLHRASAVIGIAAGLIPQTMYLPLILPKNFGGALEVGLMVAISVSAMVITFRILRRNEESSVDGSIS